MQTPDRRRNHRWFRDFWQLAKPFWISKHWKIAVLYSVGILIGALAAVYYNVLINKNNGAIMNSIANKSAPEFYNAILSYILIGGMWIVVGCSGHYLRYRQKLLWREWMTRRFIEKWLMHQRHYFWKLTQKNSTDNPDQRIAEDIRIFIDSTQELTIDVFENILTIFTYGAILWQLSGLLSVPLGSLGQLPVPGYLMWLCLGFAALSNASVFFVGRRLVSLEYEQQHCEADFRASLMKVRESAEVIALSRGEDFEIEASVGVFDRVVKNFRAIIAKFMHLEIFNEIHMRSRTICVGLAVAPRVFSGAMDVGAYTQVLGAFVWLEQCTGMLVDRFRTFADWRSAARRLVDFEESLSRAAEIQKAAAERVTAGESIGLQNVDVLTPEGKHLIERLCAEIRLGERVMFKGLSGAGKSTVFRIMAGLWPFFEGRIARPQRGDMMFLSQTPYLPVGTLRQVLLYPASDSPVTDEALMARLQQFGLGHLAAKLGVREEWGKILSPGEQQRLVIIRALIQKPKWLFLDESTTALDERHQALVYKTLKEELDQSAIISISHQATVAAVHERTVDVSPEESSTRKVS